MSEPACGRTLPRSAISVTFDRGSCYERIAVSVWRDGRVLFVLDLSDQTPLQDIPALVADGLEQLLDKWKEVSNG